MKRLNIFASVLSVMSLLAIGSVADAQTTAPATQRAALRAAAARASTIPTTNASKFAMNFKDAPLDNVLSFFSETLGFEIMKDGPIDAHVTMMSKQSVSGDEAVSMLSAALRANGFEVLREGRLLHIVSRDKAKKSNVPVHFGSDPSEIAETSELITQVVSVTNISATKLKDDLKPLIGPDADVTSNEGSNSIIITDSSVNVHRLVEIISQLDRHESTTSELHIVQLKRANAKNAAKLIDDFFKSAAGSPTANAQQGIQRNFNPGPPQNGPPAPPTGSERHGQAVTVSADDRTNSLLIMASSDQLKAIDEIIEHIDAENPSFAPQSLVQVFTLKFAAADATAKLINSIYGGTSNSSPLDYIFYNRGGSSDDQSAVKVNAVSDDRSNTVVVTGPADKLKAIESLIARLDASPMATQDLRVIHMKHADAEVVSKLLMDTFQPKQSSDNNNNNDLGFIFLVPSAPDSGKVRGQRINVTYDERTNNVLVSAPKEMQDAIEKVARDLDSDSTTEDTFFIYHLRNAQATHIAYTLNVLFGNVTAAVQFGANGQGTQLNNNQQQQQSSSQQPSSTPGGGSSSSSSSNNESSSSRNNKNYANARQLTPGLATATLNELNGQAFVVAEPDSNSLLVTAASKYETQVRKVIDDLDRPVQQVLIRILIAEVTRTNADDVGVDFSILNIRPSGNGQKGGQTFGAPATGMMWSLLEDNLTATIHALQTDGKLDVLSRPYILASDNQDATITVGQSVPFVTNSQIDQNNNTINSVEYEDIGVILDVTPHINPDGLVILDVSPEISSMTNTNIQLSPNVSSPVFQRRKASSRVGIMDGQTIVIGGLMQDQNTTTLNSVPILGSIPVLGLLFQRNEVSKTKTELLIFISPHVAALPGQMNAISESELKGTTLSHDAVGPDVYESHLRGLAAGPARTQPTEPVSPVHEIPLSPPSTEP
jgi:general secretion pathway protein D